MRIRLLLLLSVLAALAACNLDPVAASRKYVATGNKYFSREKYKEATIMYQRALQKDRKNADAYYRLAVVDLKTRQYAQAMASLQRSVQLDPNNSEAVSRLADLYFATYIQNPNKRRSELEEVRRLSDALLKRDPKSFEGLRLKAFIYIAQQNVPEAIKQFEAARQIKPNQPELMLAYCQTLVVNKQNDQAVSLAKQFLAVRKDYGRMYDLLYSIYMNEGKTADAEAVLKDKVRNNPKEGTYIAQLAMFYFATGHKDQSETTLASLTARANTIRDAYLIAAEFYLRSNQPDRALAEYRQGEQTQPDRKSVYRKREAQVLVGEGKLADASKLLDQILKDDPQDPGAISMRAALRLRSGGMREIKDAINDLQGVINRKAAVENVQDVHYNLGRAYLAKFDAEKAVADRTSLLADLEQARIQLEQAIQIAREKLSVNFFQAKLELAQVYLDKADGVRCVQLTSDVLSSNPNDVAALMLRSSANVGLRKYDDARADLEHLLKLKPNDINAAYQLGLADAQEGRFAEADHIFETVSKAGDERGLLGLIDSKNRQGKYAEAIQLIDEEMRKEPSKNQNYFRYILASTQAQAGKYDEAIANFKQLILVKPQSPDLYTRLGEACVRAGDADQAARAFKKANEMAPNDPFPILRLGLLYESMSRLDEARQQYESVLKIQPNNPVALNNLAFMKADSGSDLDQALTLAERASQQAPDDLDVKDTLAFIYTRKGLTDEGLRIFREIVAKRPGSATFRVHLAAALLQKGDKASARQELNAALANKPTSEEQRKIKELMAKAS